MGYRSQGSGGFTATKENIEEFKKICIDNFGSENIETGIVYTYIEDISLSVYDNKKIITFGFSDLKWYDNYNDVKSINEFIEKIDGRDDEYAGLMCIGEDSATFEYGTPYEVGINAMSVMDESYSVETDIQDITKIVEIAYPENRAGVDINKNNIDSFKKESKDLED